MRTRPKYRRQQFVLVIEYFHDDRHWPSRESLTVRDLKQARAELVKFAFVRDIQPYRAWVAKYQFGNTTDAEREIANTMWMRASFIIGMPGWVYKEVYLIGKDRP
jgi:hypothetical protein